MNDVRRLAALAFSFLVFSSAAAAASAASARERTTGSSPIRHLIFIVKQSRSFDHLFGTFPGADGLPANPPCQIDQWYPQNCDKPFPDHRASNTGGPADQASQVQDSDGGKMDGFVETAEEAQPQCAPGALRRFEVERSRKCAIDIMGYHDRRDIPNYWKYAETYVLFDHFYESVESWSLPGGVARFSGWSAVCSQIDPPNVNSCTSSTAPALWQSQSAPPYLWTDITYLLHQNGVSWAAYLDGGLGAPIGGSPNQVQGIWIPLGGFETVNQDGQFQAAIGSTVNDFVSQATNGTLPAVSWVIPDYPDSDQPQASLKRGQTFATDVINAVMKGPNWTSSAIFVVWSNMGGFYDHEPAPFVLDSNGPGLRVPAILISPYAKQAYIDHQILTTDSFLTLIEDTFLNGERLSQSGRPDPRPDYRDASPLLGNLQNDFTFSQAPRAPLVLNPNPMSLLVEDAAGHR